MARSRANGAAPRRDRSRSWTADDAPCPWAATVFQCGSRNGVLAGGYLDAGPKTDTRGVPQWLVLSRRPGALDRVGRFRRDRADQRTSTNLGGVKVDAAVLDHMIPVTCRGEGCRHLPDGPAPDGEARLTRLLCGRARAIAHDVLSEAALPRLSVERRRSVQAFCHPNRLGARAPGNPEARPARPMRSRSAVREPDAAYANPGDLGFDPPIVCSACLVGGSVTKTVWNLDHDEGEMAYRSCRNMVVFRRRPFSLHATAGIVPGP